jgi:hypothetical protein
VHQTERLTSALRQLTTLASLLLWLIPGSVLGAALSDVNEELIVNTDGGGSIETVGNTQITTFRVNVRIQQGLVTIFGDTARLERDTVTGDLIRVVVEGSPARFVRQAEISADIINGSSLQIIYYNQTPTDGVIEDLLSVVEFVGEANFARGRTTLECVEIKHIVETGATDSPGPCVGVFAPPAANESATEPAAEPVQ